MKAIVVRGRFNVQVVGSTISISCNDCAKAARKGLAAAASASSSSSSSGGRSRIALDSLTNSPMSGPSVFASEPGFEDEFRAHLARPVTTGGGAQLQGARELVGKLSRKEARPWAHADQAMDAELHEARPNAFKMMVVAPVKTNGRLPGCQPICCFDCGQAGLLSVESERDGTGAFGFQPMALNEDPQIHARRRAVITATALLGLDYLVRMRHVSPTASVVCAGASLQCQGKSSTGSDLQPRQDAHQILRELSIDGVPLYERFNAIPAIPQSLRQVVVYCHGVISHLDSEFNIADCLVEHHVTIEMIDLAHRILDGSLRRTSGPSDANFGRLLWGFLMARYTYAVRMALIGVEEPSSRRVLLFYASIVDTMNEEGPPDLILRGLADVGEFLKGELRPI